MEKKHFVESDLYPYCVKYSPVPIRNRNFIFLLCYRNYFS